MNLLNLASDEIHVWLAFDGDWRDARLIVDSEAMLDPGERERRSRLQAESSRHQFLVTRALQRTMLAGYGGVSPRDLQFVVGPHGKPALAAEFAGLNLHFNVAHTQGLVALAVSRESALGVDVENVTARTAALPIAKRFFTGEEASDLAALPGEEQSARFYALWTLKESWLKATGLGISAGLGNASFAFDSDHIATRATIANDDVRHWNFWQARPGTDYQLALAARRATPAGSMRVQMRRCLPGMPPGGEALPSPVALRGRSSQE